jgi:hypothetical protein
LFSSISTSTEVLRLFKTAVRCIAPPSKTAASTRSASDLGDGARDDGGRAVGIRLKEAVKAATGLTCRSA